MGTKKLHVLKQSPTDLCNFEGVKFPAVGVEEFSHVKFENYFPKISGYHNTATDYTTQLTDMLEPLFKEMDSPLSLHRFQDVTL